MSILEAILLGIVQGVTEFLPISSSGHLKLGQLLLGSKDLTNYVTFDLVCHFGTLLAVLIAFREDLKMLFVKGQKTLLLLALALLPLIPCYFLFHSIKAVYGLPQYLGFFFLITAAVLFISERFARRTTSLPSAKDAMFIGCAQAMALLPGVSRSGSTMAAARLLGWQRTDAARFSFLLAIPTISGAILLEGIDFMKHGPSTSDISFFAYGVGFVVSFIVGLFTLRWFLALLKKRSFVPFAWYCLCLGVFTLIYVNYFYLT